MIYIKDKVVLVTGAQRGMVEQLLLNLQDMDIMSLSIIMKKKKEPLH